LGEPDPLIALSPKPVSLSLPAIPTREAEMIFRRWGTDEPLMPAPWGGKQPLDSAMTVTPDVIMVPLLGFDADCNRVGQGGGHYDRYLAANLLARRIGLAWEVQRLERIDPQPWDVALDAIVTDCALYTRNLNR
jgi:5-formyltetrahydrofolate cyclo-ligase